MGSRGKGKREFRSHEPGNVGGNLVPRVLKLLGQRFGRRETKLCVYLYNKLWIFHQSQHFFKCEISDQALREYRASSVDRALSEEALTLLTLLLRYLLDTYLDSRVFSV